MWYNQRITSNYLGNRIPVSNFFILSGPSGVGKTTLIKSLIKAKPDEIVHPLTYTTRPKRRGEENGRDMVFIPKAEFAPLLTQGKFIANTEYGEHWYGTLAEDVEKPLQEGKKVVVAFDEHGVDCIQHNSILKSITIYLYPDSIQQLEKWLAGRWPDRGHTFHRRMESALAELKRFNNDPKFYNKFTYWIKSTANTADMINATLEIMGFQDFDEAA